MSGRLQILVSSVNKDVHGLPDKMNIETDAVIVNQLVGTDGESKDEVFETKAGTIRAYTRCEKGVGLSRNTALSKADSELIQFGDDDIIYDSGYSDKIIKEFDDHPEADIILFNVKAQAGRETYWNTDFAQVSWKNYGRYPAYAIAARREKLVSSGVKYSLLFGGGAPYMNGEDSLFLHDCLKAGLKLYATPVCIGEEIPRPSTWFNGYTDKFFYDRGVLYHFLYGKTAKLWGYRWLLKMKPQYSGDITFDKAKRLLFLGIADGDDVDREFDEEGNMTDADGN